MNPRTGLSLGLTDFHAVGCWCSVAATIGLLVFSEIPDIAARRLVRHAFSARAW